MRGFCQWRWHSTKWRNVKGQMVYLWRAVEQEVETRKSYVTRTRNKGAAKRVMKRRWSAIVRLRWESLYNFCSHRFTGQEPQRDISKIDRNPDLVFVEAEFVGELTPRSGDRRL